MSSNDSHLGFSALYPSQYMSLRTPISINPPPSGSVVFSAIPAPLLSSTLYPPLPFASSTFFPPSPSSPFHHPPCPPNYGVSSSFHPASSPHSLHHLPSSPHHLPSSPPHFIPSTLLLSSPSHFLIASRSNIARLLCPTPCSAGTAPQRLLPSRAPSSKDMRVLAIASPVRRAR